MNRAKLLQVVGSLPVVGSALRRLARSYPEGSVVEIRSGLAAGYKWRRHHRYVNGYWLGHYELEMQHALTSLLKPGDVFYDVGANAGFFMLVAAKVVGPAGRCVAVDPSPDNYASIQEQIELNKLDHCAAVGKAVGATAGHATFSFASPGSPMGHLGSGGAGETSIDVEVTTFDHLLDEYGKPDLIKMDIEGAEVQALEGARRLLETARPKWLIELHGPEAEARVGRTLRDAGYDFLHLTKEPVAPGASLPKHVIAIPRDGSRKESTGS